MTKSIKHTVPIAFELKNWMFTVTIGNKEVPNKWFTMLNSNDFIFECIEQLNEIEEGYAWKNFLTSTI